MLVLLSTTQCLTRNVAGKLWLPLKATALCCLLLVSALANAQDPVAIRELQGLTAEREKLSLELEQYQATIALLEPGGKRPEQSSNPAVKKLAIEMVALRERLISVTEREVTLLQEQIILANADAMGAPLPATTSAPDADAEPGIESKPIRMHSMAYNLEQEKENVKRLHALLAEYYTELQESARTLPSAEELAQRESAQRNADTLDKIPFSVDKVRLNGSEGSTALTRITQRLSDPNIPESRRDMAPICAIKTRLFGKLIGSENRSLKPVGKHNYVAKIRLQPGDTTLRIQGNSWEIRLPQDASAADYLVTLYQVPGNQPELHVFAVNDLMAEDDPHIPAWLPADLKLKTRAG